MPPQSKTLAQQEGTPKLREAFGVRRVHRRFVDGRWNLAAKSLAGPLVTSDLNPLDCHLSQGNPVGNTESRTELLFAKLFGGMNILQLPKPAGRFRKGLFKVSVSCALALVLMVLYDLCIRSLFITFLARVDWPLSFFTPLLLILFFADLLGEFRGMMLPVENSWSDQRHFTFVGIVCLALVFLLPIFYFASVQVMVAPGEGSPG